MPGAPARTVDEYIASKPAAAQQTLNQVRSAIQRAIPRAEETISYNIPTYKVRGRAALYFAGWSRFYSIYPASRILLAALGDELADASIVKSTIRFPLSKPVPVTLIGKIAKFRVKEISEREKRDPEK
jgi:uncharacterized protein YdhG (YjbR/CyaY superfamily)